MRAESWRENRRDVTTERSLIKDSSFCANSSPCPGGPIVSSWNVLQTRYTQRKRERESERLRERYIERETELSRVTKSDTEKTTERRR